MSRSEMSETNFIGKFGSSEFSSINTLHDRILSQLAQSYRRILPPLNAGGHFQTGLNARSKEAPQSPAMSVQ